MRGKMIGAVLVAGILVAGCAGSSGSGGQDYSDRCLELVIARSGRIEQETGRTGGAVFILAQRQIADEYDECAWVDD